MPETHGLDFEILCVIQYSVSTVRTTLSAIIETLTTEKKTSYFLTLDLQHISIKSVCLFDYVVLDSLNFQKILFQFICKWSEFNNY